MSGLGEQRRNHRLPDEQRELQLLFDVRTLNFYSPYGTCITLFPKQSFSYCNKHEPSSTSLGSCMTSPRLKPKQY